MITADALLTQPALSDYLTIRRNSHYHCTVEGHEPTLSTDIKLHFRDRKEPDFIDHAPPPDHGRIETRKIWVTKPINDYLSFPQVAPAFVIERH